MTARAINNSTIYSFGYSYSIGWRRFVVFIRFFGKAFFIFLSICLRVFCALLLLFFESCMSLPNLGQPFLRPKPILQPPVSHYSGRVFTPLRKTHFGDICQRPFIIGKAGFTASPCTNKQHEIHAMLNCRQV